MNYIIETSEGFFCGWDLFGNMKFVNEKSLAYRMRRRVAETTAAKITSAIGSCEIVVL